MKTVKSLRLIVLLTIAISACSQAAKPSVKTPKAVFIIVDGIPADVLENTSTPVLDSISGEGGYARAYVGGTAGGESESPTSSGFTLKRASDPSLISTTVVDPVIVKSQRPSPCTTHA